MNFQDALTLLKEGKTLRRESWTDQHFLLCHRDRLDHYSNSGPEFTSYHWAPDREDLFANDWQVVVEKLNFIGALKLLKQGLRVRHTSWQPKSYIRLSPLGTIRGFDPAGQFGFADFDINELLSENWIEYSGESRDDTFIDVMAFFGDAKP